MLTGTKTATALLQRVYARLRRLRAGPVLAPTPHTLYTRARLFWCKQRKRDNKCLYRRVKYKFIRKSSKALKGGMRR